MKFREIIVGLLTVLFILPCFGAPTDYKVTNNGEIYGYDLIVKRPWVDVRAFGAKGDGVTDDTVAIQSAFDAIETAHGGTVLFPYGNYKATSTINLPNYADPTGPVSVYRFLGNGAKITYTGASQLFRKYPAAIGDINNVTMCYVFEGFGFYGPSNRTSIAIDIACSTNTRIANCSFSLFGTAIRLVYSFWPIIQSCNFYDNFRTGVWIATGYGLLPGGGTAGANVGAGQVIDNCHFYSQLAAQVTIERMKRGNPCVVTSANHGMMTGDLVFLSDIKQADWKVLDKTRHAVTKIDDNSFSIAVNTSGYAAEYDAGPYPSHYAKHVSCLILAPGQVDVRQCGFEGNSGIDNIYLYGEGGGASSHRFTRIYHENVPIAKGSLICLDKDYSGYLTVDDMTHAQSGITVIDAYDANSTVLDLRNFHIVQTAYMRATRSTKLVNVAWNIRHFGLQNEGVDWTNPSYWIDAVRPTDGYGTLTSYRTSKIYSFYHGMKFGSADGHGGMGVEDVDNQQSSMMLLKSNEITCSGASAIWSNAIPAGTMVIGVTARVINAITGTSSFDIGDGTTVNLFAHRVGVVKDTTSDLANGTATGPTIYQTTKNIVLTPYGGNFTGGKVRITVHYIRLNPPSS